MPWHARDDAIEGETVGDPITRSELVALVERIKSSEGTEEEQDALVRLLMRRVLHPRILDLIYYPHHEGCEHNELTAEQVVDAALAYEPIAL